MHWKELQIAVAEGVLVRRCMFMQPFRRSGNYIQQPCVVGVQYNGENQMRFFQEKLSTARNASVARYSISKR
uniref:Uncharacterized protein n=1 Tax=Peronospora matthiolae TaxID=2874970 RepID=A0AAV1URR6_9STRA